MLDGDDCLVNPSYVARAVDLALSAEDVVLVFGKHLSGPDVDTATVCNSATELPPLMDGSAFFLQHPPFFDVQPAPQTCLVRRDAATRIGFYRYDILSSDFESYYRLMIGHKIGFVDEIAALWRQHARNASKTGSYEAYRENFKALTGPHDNAGSLQVFSARDLKAWLRKGAARYFLFCLYQLLAMGRIWDALRLSGYMLSVDPGIAGHAVGRLVRRTTRHLNGRPGSAGAG
jgi:hypothetical protein